MKYPLIKDTIDKNDLKALSDWLLTNPRLTKGPLTVEFEKQWSSTIGVENSVFVNSGSSAILIALSALIENGTLSRGDKVLVPNLSWHTDISSVINLGLIPYFADADLNSGLAFSIESLQNAIDDGIKAAILVTVLGFIPNNILEYVDLCKKSKVVLIEDSCETLGSSVGSRTSGTFGDVSLFSFYYGHHISTIEGGMVSTNNESLYRSIKSIRSHGWMRDEPESVQQRYKNMFCGGDDFYFNYTFFNSGFNLRSTDLQAFIGLRQLKKIPSIKATRHLNYIEATKHNKNVYTHKQNGDISNFAIPLMNVTLNQKELLIDNGVEIRPMLGGSMIDQPFMTKWMHRNKIKPNQLFFGEDLSTAFSVSREIKENWIYLPNNQMMNTEDVKSILKILE